MHRTTGYLQRFAVLIVYFCNCAISSYLSEFLLWGLTKFSCSVSHLTFSYLFQRPLDKYCCDFMTFYGLMWLFERLYSRTCRLNGNHMILENAWSSSGKIHHSVRYSNWCFRQFVPLDEKCFVSFFQFCSLKDWYWAIAYLAGSHGFHSVCCFQIGYAYLTQRIQNQNMTTVYKCLFFLFNGTWTSMIHCKLNIW